MNEKKSDQKINSATAGFSILEVLIAFGLIAIVAAGIASLTTSGMKQQRGLQAKDQQREVTAEIRNLLNNKIACTNSFGGSNPATGFNATTIRDASAAPGVPKFTVNTNDKTGLLRFEEFRVSGFVVDPTNVNQGTAELAVKLSKVGDTGTVKDIKPDIIMLKTVRDAGGNIIDCFSIGGKNEALWQIGTNLSDIYYPGGNVGIGTTIPATPLHVSSASGAVVLAIGTDATDSAAQSVIELVTVNGATKRLDNPATKGWQISGVGSTYGAGPNRNDLLITHWDGATMSSGIFRQDFIITAGTGNVGIGTNSPTAKLEVSGGIKPGSATTGGACAPEGAFAYDMTVHAPVYCNNLGRWTGMAAASSPSGTLCGGSVEKYGAFQPLSGYSMCQGLIPARDGCPSGYTRVAPYSASLNWFITCQKN